MVNAIRLFVLMNPGQDVDGLALRCLIYIQTAPILGQLKVRVRFYE